MSGDFLGFFKVIEDPRSKKNQLYPLEEILFLCVCAVLSGADGWAAITQFGRSKLEWFRRFLPYEQGFPNEDTIAWLMGRLKPEVFERCFIEWVNSFVGDLNGEVIAIDGKTARRSHDKRRSKNPLHMVSAWACSQRVSLGQLPTDEKSNEITAIPALLELLEIKGALITTDAMGCQRDIASKIAEEGADYVLALKGNQRNMHEAVVDYFEVAEAAGFAQVPVPQKTTVDSDHGRIETRQYYLITDLCTLPDPEAWKNLSSIGMAITRRENKASGKVTEERRYYLNSITEIDRFAEAVRNHWGVENSLHWVLDMVFREDESRIRKGETPAVFNMLRQIANNLLRKMNSKLSIKARRFQAALDDEFRTRAIFGE